MLRNLNSNSRNQSALRFVSRPENYSEAQARNTHAISPPKLTSRRCWKEWLCGHSSAAILPVSVLCPVEGHHGRRTLDWHTRRAVQTPLSTHYKQTLVRFPTRSPEIQTITHLSRPSKSFVISQIDFTSNPSIFDLRTLNRPASNGGSA